MQMSRIISTTCRHAIRALCNLARRAAGESVTGHELAEAEGIPQNYLAKVMKTMGRAGLVEAVRGMGGGYALARDAADIRLAEVVDLIDGGGEWGDCLLANDAGCPDPDDCPVHAAWQRMRQTFAEFLATTTIADLTTGSGGSER